MTNITINTKFQTNLFTEHSIDFAPPPDDDISIRAIIDATALRYSEPFHKVNWIDIIDQVLPLISHHRKSVMMHLSAQFSLNPLLMVAKIFQDQQRATNNKMISDEEFRISAKLFANTLSVSEQDFHRDEETDMDDSTLRYGLRRAYKNNDDMIRNFLNICDALSKKHNLPTLTRETNPHVRQSIVKREEEEEISLQLPFAQSECWQLSATHFAATETQSSAIHNGKMAAIDMSPYMFSVSILILHTHIYTYINNVKILHAFYMFDTL